MSTEFYAEALDENSLSHAVSSFNEMRTYYKGLPSFLSKIHDDYESTEGGIEELQRVRRVSQFIAQSPGGQFDTDAQAVFNGQLIAMQILNYTYQEDAPITDIAKPYLDRHTADLDTHSIESYSDLAQTIQANLSADSVTLSKTHEAFIKKISKELYSDTKQQELAAAGFRLVISEVVPPQAPTTEHLKPTSTPLDSIAPAMSYAEFERRFEALKQPEWKDISYVGTEIVSVFNSYVNAFEGIPTDKDDIGFTIGINGLVQNRLKAYNKLKQLVEADEPLRLNGNTFILHTQEGKGYTDHIDENSDILGTFDGFTTVKAPSSGELALYTRTGKTEYPNKQLAPAIKIKDPIVIRHGISGPEYTIEFSDTTFKIPLSYLGLKISRLDIPELAD